MTSCDVISVIGGGGVDLKGGVGHGKFTSLVI